MIERITTTTATTLTTPRFRGAAEVVEDPDRQRLGRAGGERRDDDLVEAQREGEQRAGDERRAHLREGDVAEVRARAARRGRPTPPRASAGVRRSRATTLLKTTTMQNVAWPMITVQSDRLDAEHLREGRVQRHAGDDARAARSAGSRGTRSSSAEEVDSARRCSEASVPRTIAIAVAPTPTLTLVHSASRTPSLSHASREPAEATGPRGGHSCTVVSLKA